MLCHGWRAESSPRSETFPSPGRWCSQLRHTCPFPEGRTVQTPTAFCFDSGTIHPKGTGQAKHNQKRSGSWQSCPPKPWGHLPEATEGLCSLATPGQR